MSEISGDNQDSEIQTTSGEEDEHMRARSSNLGRRLLVLKCKIFNERDLKERVVDLIELATEKLDCLLSLGDMEDDGQFGLQEVRKGAEVFGEENEDEDWCWRTMHEMRLRKW